MKRKFSTAWKGSSQVRKQRKYRHNAPLHVKHKFLSAHLSKELRAKHKTRNLPLRRGDEVLVMRGTFAKKKAKVLAINTNRMRFTLEGITRSKKDGSKVPVFFKAHAVQIVSLIGEDKRRLPGETKHAPNKS